MSEQRTTSITAKGLLQFESFVNHAMAEYDFYARVDERRLVPLSYNQMNSLIYWGRISMHAKQVPEYSPDDTKGLEDFLEIKEGSVVLNEGLPVVKEEAKKSIEYIAVPKNK